MRLQHVRTGNRQRRQTYLPRVELLEDRLAPATFTVLNTADSGADSLRQAILDANATPGLDLIDFNIPGSGTHTITPGATSGVSTGLGGLPILTDPVTIDARLQPGYLGNPLIEINGASAGPAHGLFITAGGSTVAGLIINDFSDAGILLWTNGNNTIVDNFIGTDAPGTAARGNGRFGVLIENGSTGNQVLGNTISANAEAGVWILTDDNVVAGNYIGTDVGGTLSLPNELGIYFGGGVGSEVLTNVIAFNTYGLVVDGNASSGHVIQDNSVYSQVEAGMYLAGSSGDDTIVIGPGAAPGVTTLVINGATIAAVGNSGTVKIDGGEGSDTYAIELDGLAVTIDVDDTGISDSDALTVQGTSGPDAMTLTGSQVQNGAGTVVISSPIANLTVEGGGGDDTTTIAGFTAPTTNLTVDGSGGTNAVTIVGSPPAGVNLDLVSAVQAAAVNAMFTVRTTADSGPDSLRQAILDANATPGLDLIAFDIPGSGPHTITPGATSGVATGLGGLPIITDPVIIDGYSQPGSRANSNGPELGTNAVLTVELNGASAGGTAGLEISAGASTVRGLVINRFDGFGVLIHGDTASGNKVQGNFIGTDVTGTQALGNLQAGVFLDGAPGNMIGGLSTGERNVISASGDYGIDVQSEGNFIQGNFIGTDATGTQALGNGGGVILDADTNNLPDNNTLEGNLISGNDLLNYGAVEIYGSYNRILGNRIGTQADGTTPLGNPGHGIYLNWTADYNTIGGTEPGAANIIAFNGGDGVFLDEFRAQFGDQSFFFFGTGNQISANAIYANAGLGINLAPDGVTPNDADDGDQGANQWQNYPVLTAASSAGGATTIQGTLNSTANSSFRLEFFSNVVSDPTGFGEGQTFLGAHEVTTDASSNASFTVHLATGVTPGHFVTATATDQTLFDHDNNADSLPVPRNNTSEFSANVAVSIANRPPVITSGGGADHMLRSVQAISVSNPLLQPASATGDNTSLLTVIASERPPPIASVSADGRYVVFVSKATDLPTGNAAVVVDGDSFQDVYVRNLVTQETRLVSVDYSGYTKGNGDSYFPIISADGRFVAFTSKASNLDPLGGVDTDAFADLYIWDRLANDSRGGTRLVSVNDQGNENVNDELTNIEIPYQARLSDDGRYVFFLTSATNLDPRDTVLLEDLYRWDSNTGTTTLVSVNSAGEIGNRGVRDFDISADGRYVALWSESSNLHPGDTDTESDVFLRDLELGTTDLVNGDNSTDDRIFITPLISADGEFVVFTGFDTDFVGHIYRWNRLTDVTVEVGVNTLGVAANGAASLLGMSANGQRVLFASNASNLDPLDPDTLNDHFVRDLAAGTTTLVNLSDDETLKAAGTLHAAVLSADGESVAFRTTSSIDPLDLNTLNDVYLRNLTLGTTVLVSMGSYAGNLPVQGDSLSTEHYVAISAHGEVVVFDSVADNLVANDLNDARDVFANVISSNGGDDTAALSVPENTTAVTTVTATDLDADTLTFSIVGGADAAFFAIDPDTGTLAFQSAPNFEALSDDNADNVYEVQVQVSDGLLTDTQVLSVTVTDVSETPVNTYRFDFNNSQAPNLTAPGYIGVLLHNLYPFHGLGYGWNVPVLDFDHGGPDDLRRDGHDGVVGEFFRVDLPAGTYQVSVTSGDGTSVRDFIEVYAEGTAPADRKLNFITTGGNSWDTQSFDVAVTDGTLDLFITDAGGLDPYWLISALDIRPLSLVGAIALSGPGGVLAADGLSVDTYTGATAGLMDGALVTVSTTLGTVVATDMDPFQAGVQVQVQDDSISFDIRRPTGPGSGSAIISAREVSGLARGELIQNYDLPTERHFDFNNSQAPNLTAPGYIGVLLHNLYPFGGAGYGWNDPVLDFDHGGPDDLRRDGHDGVVGEFFRVDLPAGTYQVSVTSGDGTSLRDFIEVYAEGTAPVDRKLNFITTGGGTWDTQSFNVVVTDGTLDLFITDAGGLDPYWLICGLDIVYAGPANQAPMADAGGAYTIVEGGPLTLDAALSFDPEDVLSYSWDVNGDGVFGDATGVSPTLSPTALALLGINDGPSTWNVRVQVSDGINPVVTSAATLLTVLNADPALNALANSSPAFGGTRAGEAVAVTGSFMDAGLVDTHTALIHWGDGMTTAATITEASGVGTLLGSHSYQYGGLYTITVVLTDDDGGTDVQTTSAVITGAGVQGSVLYIIGTNDDDQVTVKQVGNLLKVQGSFLPKPFVGFAAAGVTQIHVILGDGDDRANIAGGVALPAIMEGGNGNDRLSGSHGNDILLGGAGDDVLLGAGGQDILIGGTGADRITAQAGEDLLIAGHTTYDDNLDALALLLAEWTSSRSYAARIDNLRGIGSGPDFQARLNGNVFLTTNGPDATVFDDGARDVLRGRAGLDWFFANLDGGVLDVVADLKNGLEMVADLD